MKQMTLRALTLLILTSCFVGGVCIFGLFYVMDAKSWALYPTNSHLFSNGEIVHAGKILDRKGVVLAETKDGKRVFNPDSLIRKSTIHTVGDLNGFIATGLHSSYLKELSGYNEVDGVYSYANTGNDIKTTIDSKVSVAAAEALGNRNGIVAVYNWKTGEVITMVSNPTFDVNDSEKNENNGVYLNKVLSGTYVPGSTFKIITAAAGLDVFGEALYNKKYTCKSGVMINNEWISCMGNHGDISLKNALAKSCNAYFSQLAVDLGKDEMTRFAQLAGFNRTFNLNGIKTKRSIFDVEKTRDIDLAWAGMGQHTDMMNPLQYLTFMGAIANGGVPVKPYLIESITSPMGLPGKIQLIKNEKRMLPERTANQLAELMHSNVTLNYGEGNYYGFDLCAKSGTAEVGGDLTPNAVFVGFTRNEELPLAFVVVVENGGAGSKVGGAVAKRVLDSCKANLLD